MPEKKILLINPQLPEASWLNSSVAGISPPLGLAYMSAYLGQRGYKVSIIDNAAEFLSLKELVARAEVFSPSLVGITSTTTNYNTAAGIAGALKGTMPAVPVIMGGAHASALPEYVLENKNVDAVVRGDGEAVFYNLAEKMISGGSLADVKGVTFRDGGGIKANPPQEVVGDLDSLPFPAYELLPMHLYHPSLSRRLTPGRFASIVTSRGCPYACSFCSHSVFGHTHRLRSPGNVIKEVEFLKKEYGISELLIWDDTFTAEPARAAEIAKGIKRVANIPWSCYSRTDHADDDLYKTFYECGLREMLFGAESGSNEILRNANKGITIEDTRKAVSLAKKNGISAFCSVILGLPGDTRETIKETIDFFTRVDPDYAAFCVLIPFPGAPLFDKAVKDGLLDIKKTDWESYVTIFSSKPPPCSMCEVPVEELTALQKYAFRKFLFRVGYVAGRVGKALKDGPFRLIAFIRGLSTVIKHQAHRHMAGMGARR